MERWRGGEGGSEGEIYMERKREHNTRNGDIDRRGESGRHMREKERKREREGERERERVRESERERET